MGLSNRGKSNRLFDGSRLNVLGQGIKTILQGFFSGKKIPEYPNPGIASINQTPTPTPTNTPTAQTPTPTPTNTSTPSVTPTQTKTPTQTQTNTRTQTSTPTNTRTQTKTPTQTKTQTKTPTQTKTQTPTPTQTQTNTRTQTQTPTNTRTQTQTNTQTRTQTPTNTQTRTQTKTPTQTKTQTPTNTGTPTQTKTQTPTPTTTPTPTKTSTPTPTPTKTSTQTKTSTPTNTKTQTQTKTPTQTATQTKTPTQTPTQTATNTQTPTNTQTQTPTSVPCFCFALNNTFSSEVGYTILDCNNIFSGDEKAPVGESYRCANQITPYDSNILSVSIIGACDGVDCPPFTPTPTPTNTATPTNTPTNTKTQTQTKTQTPTNTATISQTPSTTPTNTPTPSITPTNTQTQTQTSSQTPTVTPTITETPTNTPTQTNTTTNTQTPTNTSTPTQTKTQTPTATCIKPISLPTISLTSAWYSAPGQSGTEVSIIPLNDTQACQQYQLFSQWFNPSTEALLVEVASYAINEQIYNFGGTSCICNVPNGNYWTNALDPTLDPTNTSGVDIVQIFNCQIVNINTNCQSPIDTSPTPTPTTTRTPTQTQTQTPTKDETPTPTPTNTTTPTNTSTQTQTPTNTQTQTQTPTNTQTQTCQRPIDGIGAIGASRYYLSNDTPTNLLFLNFENSCNNYKNGWQVAGSYISEENLHSLFIYPGISEGTNVATVFPLAGSSCFCNSSIQGNWWVNYTDPQAPPTQSSGIYWVSVDSNCSATISACTISIPETPTPTPTITQTPSQTITQTPSQTTTQTPSPTLENRVVLRSIAGRNTGITGTKGNTDTFNITYDMGMGGGEILYNGLGQTAVNLFSAQTQNNRPVLFKNPVIIPVPSAVWNTVNKFKIQNASAIEDNTLLFYFDKIGRCTSIDFTTCSFNTLSNTYFGNQGVSNLNLSITNHLSGLTINDSFWPQEFLNNTNISSFGFTGMKGNTTMELNFQSMTSMTYIGIPNGFPNNTGLTSVSINLPLNFGSNTVPTSFLSSSVNLGNCLFLTAVTFPNSTSIVGLNFMGINISQAQRLLTIGNLPINTQKLTIEGFGTNENNTLSLTSMTTNFSQLTKLTILDITKTRLNSPNFPTGGLGIQNATLLTNLNLSANLFTIYPVLPPNLTIFNMGNNKFTASPSSNTYFPPSITDITLTNSLTFNSGGGSNNIPTWNIDFSNMPKLLNFYLVQVGLTAWNPSNVFPKTTKIVDLQSNPLLTTFNANCLSATTATTVVSLNLNNCNLTEITNLSNSGTLKELNTRNSRFANKNDISTFPITLTKWDSQNNGVPLPDFIGKAFTANMNYLDMQRFGLNIVSVDYILAWFANTTNNNLSNGTIKLENMNVSCTAANANCNQIPTNGNNNASRLLLLGRGWTVNVRTV